MFNKKIQKKIAMGLILSTLVCTNANLSFALSSDTNSKVNLNKTVESMDVEGLTVDIIKDNSDTRIARVSENGITSLATLDKKENILSIEQIDEKTGETLEKTTSDLKELQSSDSDSKSRVRRWASSYDEEKTYTNYEYKYEIIRGSYNDKWEIRIPKPSHPVTRTKCKHIQETKRNTKSLNKYKGLVDDINELEADVIWDTGFTFTSAALSLIAAPVSGGGTIAAAVAGLGALGFGRAAIKDCQKLIRKTKDANALYYQL